MRTSIYQDAVVDLLANTILGAVGVLVAIYFGDVWFIVVMSFMFGMICQECITVGRFVVQNARKEQNHENS